MLKRLRKENKKGFTLVELIVVLVILAILAALLVPALTGYIDRAKEKQVIAETRQSVMAAQTMADEEYAKGTADAAIATALNGTDNGDLKSLADVPGTIASIEVKSGRITKLVYTNGLECTYEYDDTAKKGSYSDPVTPVGP